MAIFGTVETVRAQAPRAPGFVTAWNYVTELLEPGSVVDRRLAATAAGESKKHALDAGVFAIEQAYMTKPRKEGFFESHRKFIDIQVVVEGMEVMEVIDREHAVVREPYDESRDLIVYADSPDASVLQFRRATVAVFFPHDVHMPSLRCASTAALVRKTVLKVPV